MPKYGVFSFTFSCCLYGGLNPSLFSYLCAFFFDVNAAHIITALLFYDES